MLLRALNAYQYKSETTHLCSHELDVRSIFYHKEFFS
jgi:hypothetical protein